MNINWLLVTVLFSLSIPGVLIAIQRLMSLLLPPKTPSAIKKRFQLVATCQMLLISFVVCLSGHILSQYTHLSAPVLNAILAGQSIFLPVFYQLPSLMLYTATGLIIFLLLYYYVVASSIGAHNFQVMESIRRAFQLDGCILFGGIVEEIFARWGLLNILIFPGLFFSETYQPAITGIAILLSGICYSIPQLPAYLSAGATYSRRFLYAFILLNIWQAILFGSIFWRHGILAAMASHILFHLGWWMYAQLTE